MSFLYSLESIRTPFLDRLMGLVTELGGESVFMAAAIVVFWCVSKSCGYYMLTTGLAGTVINQFLKLLCRVPRPWVKDPGFTIVESARADATGYSFPSGHTQNSFAVLGAPARWLKRRLWGILGAVFILLTAFSRMYLGVHTPLDVGFSLALGAALVFALYPIFMDMDQKPRRVLVLFLAFILSALAFLMYTYCASGADAHEIAHARENAWMLLFCSVGLILVWQADRRYIRFDVSAPLKWQFFKAIVGLGIVLGIRLALKAPFAALFNSHPASDGLRYFIMIIFAGILWPMTFKWYKKK